ncbi:MAG: AmmeMemoRadiSam system protein B [Spirochaetaceae bacterium]
MKQSSREPLVAGIFYPAGERELKELIEERAEALESPESGAAHETIPELTGLVLPHAAYECILPLLLEGFNLLRVKDRSPTTIILAAGLHREKRSGIFLPPFSSFSSPLGEVKVETDSIMKIQETVEESCTEELPYLEEHSFEVLLPLISHYFPRASVVPILTGDNEKKSITAFSKALKLLENREGENSRTALMVSSNITGETDRKNAELQKKAFFTALKGVSTEDNGTADNGDGTADSGSRAAEFERLLSAGRITACGAAALAGLMRNCPTLSAVPLRTGTSRRGDEAREVIYGTIALAKGAL